MPSDADIVRLRHMFDAARNAIEFAEGQVRADLDSDRKLALADLERAVSMEGEG